MNLYEQSSQFLQAPASRKDTGLVLSQWWRLSSLMEQIFPLYRCKEPYCKLMLVQALSKASAEMYQDLNSGIWTMEYATRVQKI